jgi:hypothetical protein
MTPLVKVNTPGEEDYYIIQEHENNGPVRDADVQVADKAIEEGIRS